MRLNRKNGKPCDPVLYTVRLLLALVGTVPLVPRTTLSLLSQSGPPSGSTAEE